MPKMFLALLVATAVLAQASKASAQDYPFCIRGGDYDSGIGDCSFTTLEQCQASASGRDSYCAANPFFHGSTERPASRTPTPRRR